MSSKDTQEILNGAALLFLETITKCAIPSETDVDWVHAIAKAKKSNQPCGDESELVRSFLEHGITAEQIARYAKIVAYEAVFTVCYTLEDSSYWENKQGYQWGWGVTDEDGKYIGATRIGLHSELITFDPCGRQYSPDKGNTVA